MANALQRLALAVLCLWAPATAADNGRGAPQSAPDTPDTPAMFFNASTTLQGLAGARMRSDGTLLVKQLGGTGILHAEHVIIEGVLSPGNSPGCIDFGGDVTFSVTAMLQIELGGTTPCTEYDRITVANTLTLNGPVLQLVLLPGFTPAYGDRFDVLNWGTLVGAFGAIDSNAALLPYPLVWNTAQLYLTGELVVDVQHIADGDLAPWNAPDGFINAADVLIASQLALGLRTAGALQNAHGDMNTDSVIDLSDLLLIQQLVLP